MPSSTATANSKTASINDYFRQIGKADGSAMPRWKGKPTMLTAALAAWEYHVASHLLRIAETRRAAAITAAIKAGVLFDHSKAPLPVGTNRIVYAGAIVEITVSVAAGVEGVDHTAFVADLIKAKVDPKLIGRLSNRHKTETRPAHKFVSSLVTR